MKPTREQVKAARARAGLTIAKAAALLGVGHRTWQHWETGDTQMSASHFEVFNLRTQPTNPPTDENISQPA